jgi:hypothetical protein
VTARGSALLDINGIGPALVRPGGSLMSVTSTAAPIVTSSRPGTAPHHHTHPPAKKNRDSSALSAQRSALM